MRISVKFEKIKQIRETSIMSIERILEMNENSTPKTIVMEKEELTYAACLRLVAALSRLLTDGLYWKIKKNTQADGRFDLKVVGHAKGDMHISPEFFSSMMNSNIKCSWLDKGDNFVGYALREEMNEYTFDQFATEGKIKEYMHEHGTGKNVPSIAPADNNGCSMSFMILHIRS